jgi:hypothetical protein
MVRWKAKGNLQTCVEITGPGGITGRSSYEKSPRLAVECAITRADCFQENL